jgi:hypothetical protein
MWDNHSSGSDGSDGGEDNYNNEHTTGASKAVVIKQHKPACVLQVCSVLNPSTIS